MGHGDGRPGTPAPDHGGGGEAKATFSGGVVLVGIISFVLGVIAVAVPYWGLFRPQSGDISSYATYGAGLYENSGFFGPWNKCMYASIGYRKICGDNIRYQVEVYLKIGGVCALVQVGSIAMFTMLAGLHCAMQINNKNIMIKYSTNVFLAFLSAVVAAIATIAAVLISIPQFLLRKQEFTTEPGACYYIEVALVFINILLSVVSYLSYAKARKTNFPRQRNPYEISANSYGDDHVGGVADPGRGISVIHPNSGVVQGYQGGHTLSQLPQFPAPSHAHQYINGQGQLGQHAQPQVPAPASHAHYYSGQPVAAVAPQQGVPRFVPARDERVDLNPGGRHKTDPNKLASGGGVMGSMESLNSNQDSVFSFGSTVSSNASINNPLRSSLKKPRNKDNVSVASNASSSKKSVRLALGEEQTAV